MIYSFYGLRRSGNHASNEDCVKILYEKWLISQEYRNSIYEHLNISNFDNIKDVYSF